MPYAQHMPETRFGSFIQAWSTHGGRGRVVAWGDSTIFSNFCLYQPGKAQVLLNLVEWLNHQGGHGRLVAVDACWGWRRSATGCGWSATTVRAWLVLVAATACGWILGSTATAALLAREMPLPAPQQDRRLPQVVIDRTTSQVPLAKGAVQRGPRQRTRVRVAGAVDSALGLSRPFGPRATTSSKATPW